MTASSRPSILFMGTPDFARIILQKLHEEGFPIVAVYAQPDKPVGRGQKLASPPVAEYAKKMGLKLLQPPKLRDEAILAEMKSFDADFFVVAAYGKILSDAVLVMPKKECLNVHASLLPDYRGAAPINYAILDGKDKTGVAIMRVVKELDAGPVFFARETKINEQDDAVTLTQRLAEIGAEALIATLEKITIENLKPAEQDHARASYASKLSKEMGQLTWNQSALKLFNQVRALLPWPVAETALQGQSLKIYKTEVLPQKSTAAPGTVTHIAKAGWTVATATTDLLVKEVQLAGRKRMNAFDLANGMRLNIPTQLGM